MTTGTANLSLLYDDFAIKGEYAYLTTSGNSIEHVALDGQAVGQIIAGRPNSTRIAQPTSCASERTSRYEHVLYVTNAGGLSSPINGNIPVGGEALAIDTGRWKQVRFSGLPEDTYFDT
ncbi:hypothetical protein PG996_014485 [Apiospora saccharicola]|uniref:Uncharacterized protein n=1 Tax=Apiospora saccharicola TaxID=335842 RepID=A0ABR1TIG6_9PEZI